MNTEQSSFATLRAINVNEHTEKKGNLTYLSWSWAVDQLLQRDPAATWDYRWIGDVPYCQIGETAMVFCTVKAFGVERTAQLPIMDHKNKPIPNPDAFQTNTAMQRCLAKAIALHGIGLYIYAGEDLPDDPEAQEQARARKEADKKMRLVADAILIKFGEGNHYGMLEEWDGIADNENKLAVWAMLKPHSAVRSAIKAQQEIVKAAAAKNEAPEKEAA